MEANSDLEAIDVDTLFNLLIQNKIPAIVAQRFKGIKIIFKKSFIILRIIYY